MTIREKVARKIQFPDRGRTASLRALAITDIAITAFLEAAAEEGWHMRQDITGTGPDAAAREFEWGQ